MKYNKRKRKPTKAEVQKWKLKDWEKSWDKQLLSIVLNNIKGQWDLDGTITAPDWEVLAYILEVPCISYLIHCLIKLEKKDKKIMLIRKDEELYLDYIPF